jgi:hypothetical protein
VPTGKEESEIWNISVVLWEKVHKKLIIITMH